MSKVVIWGHKYNNHTHGRIHSSYFKAFKNLGYETYWLDDRDDVYGFNFENCIFLTEDQSQKKIPLIKSSKYILHHTKIDKYIDNGLNFINLANYLSDCQKGLSPYHKGNTVEKINDYCFFDNKTNTIYQPWATDLTKEEINNISPIISVGTDLINYVGVSHDNRKEISSFSNKCSLEGKKFNIISNVSDNDNKKLIRESYLSVDIRGPWHKECGYLPCRVFKNISYGRLTGTNSKHVKEIFGDYVVYSENVSDLYDKLVQTSKTVTSDFIKESMIYISENHTYENRINNLINLL